MSETSQAEIKKVADLAKLTINDEEQAEIAANFQEILSLIDEINQANTHAINPMASSLSIQQRLRVDVVTEENQRDAFQAIAPLVKNHLYLVPKVIEE